MAKPWLLEPDSFRRMFDDMFDELLVNRWRRQTHIASVAEGRLLEYDDRYEAQIATGDADPRGLEVVVGTNRLMIALKTGFRTRLERVFSFSEQIDTAGVRARWWEGVLTVVLPKRGKVAREDD